jgi:hypothetical protein
LQSQDALTSQMTLLDKLLATKGGKLEKINMFGARKMEECVCVGGGGGGGFGRKMNSGSQTIKLGPKKYLMHFTAKMTHDQTSNASLGRRAHSGSFPA